MSYEGYTQVLCKNGHYSTREPYYHGFGGEGELCPICKEEIVWMNEVDQTNIEEIGYIEMVQFLKEPRKTETCQCCGHTKEVAPATYRIPTAQEKEAARQFRDEDGNLHPLSEWDEYCGLG